MCRSCVRAAPIRTRVDETGEQAACANVALGERLGMPLHGDEVSVVVAFERLDEAIGRFGGGVQALTKLLHTLVVHAVDAQRARADKLREARSFMHADLVREEVAREALPTEGEVVVLD